MTTVVSGLHPLVASALEAHGCGTLTSVQHQTLSRATSVVAPGGGGSGSSTVPPDCIVETPRGSGHCLCMVAYAAHFVHSHSGGEAPFAIIVARDNQSLVRILNVSSIAQIPAVRFVDASTLETSSAKLGTSAFPLQSRVLIGTVAGLSSLDFGCAAEARANCVTLMVEESAPDAVANSSSSSGGVGSIGGGSSTSASSRKHHSKGSQRGDAKLTEFINSVNTLWPNVNLCMMSTRPPSAVHASLRYLLRRNNRCYLPARSAVPVFSTILCLSADDRASLCSRLTQIHGLRRVLILTHNREVRDLKTDLHKSLGLRTFSIQRATSQDERERVLTDFLECDFGVLVAMDAFTGVDLMDVDGVVQYYPPQKSMTDDEWTEYVSFLRTTGESGIDRSSQCVITLAAPDDLSMIKHLQSRVGYTGPVMNISPNHVNFEDFVLQPNLAVMAKLPPDEQEAAGGGGVGFAAARKQYEVVGRSTTLPTTGGATTSGSQHHYNKQQQQQQHRYSSNRDSGDHHHGSSSGSSGKQPQQQRGGGGGHQQQHDRHHSNQHRTNNKNKDGNGNGNNNSDDKDVRVPGPRSGDSKEASSTVHPMSKSSPATTAAAAPSSSSENTKSGVSSASGGGPNRKGYHHHNNNAAKRSPTATK